MQTILYFVAMFTTSVANDGYVYVYDSVANYDSHLPAMTKPTVLFEIQYHKNDMLNMKIILINVPQNVYKNVYRKSAPGVTSKRESLPCNPIRGKFCEFKQLLKAKQIFIEFELSSTNGLCARKQNIIQGKRVAWTTERISNTPYNDICLTSNPCVIEVDLRNTSGCEIGVSTADLLEPTNTASKETTTNKTSGSDDKSSELQTWIYVTSSVIVMCVLILTIYISVKKYRRRNSRPVETMELNTYATVNEVVYADLSLAHGDSLPPRRDESLYAQIVGVMRPVHGNVKKK